ncbi:MAG: FtsX-like permease family protein, partial [Acidobacteriota bacterium]
MALLGGAGLLFLAHARLPKAHGVTDANFSGSSLHQPQDLQVPASMMGKIAGLVRDNDGWAQILARLKPEVPRGQAAQRLEAVGQQLSRAFLAKVNDKDKVYFLDGSQGLNSRKEQFGRPTQILMLLVGIVFLVACANLAALLLVRSVERTREAGMRVALGASKWTLFRQFFAESVLLAATGGLAGAALAWLLIRVLAKYLVAQNPGLIAQVKLDPAILAFTAGLSVAAALLFGTLPAWRAAGADPLPALHGATSAGRRRPIVSRMILAAQVALSLTLLFSAGLFARTLANLKAVDLGFQAENLIILRPRLDGTLHIGPRRMQFFQDLLQRANQLPSVRSASLGQIEPLSGSMSGVSLTIPGFLPPNGLATSPMNFVSRGYFQTLGVPFLAGEDFPDRVPDGNVRPAVVNLEFARRFLGGDAIGKQFKYGGGREVSVIGVVGATKYRYLRED